MGRHLAAEYGAPDIPAVIIRSGPVDDFRQTATNVLSVGNLDDFEFPYDEYDPSDDAEKGLCFLVLDRSSSMTLLLHATRLSGSFIYRKAWPRL